MTRSRPDPRSSVPAGRSAQVWLFGNIRFDDGALTVECGGKRVELERRPLELLRLLLAYAGEVVTKDELLSELWPDREVTENSLTKCVARLRQALGPDGGDAIRTVHGYGYQFVAPLHTAPRPSGATISASSALQPGDVLPHRSNWRLVERLGTGGSADIWLGEHAKTHERRAFKFAHDSAQLTALKREITLSRLLHDQLGARDDFARVLDWNLETPPYFIEREWSPFGALPDWAAAQGGIGQVPLPVRLDLAAQIADALAAAHSVGVLHKDVKPANVLIHAGEAGNPRIRLADLGSGSALDADRFGQIGITPLGFTRELGEAESTQTTRLYAAPEVLQGGPASVQADVYSLGVVLYQLIVGDFSRPFAPGWEAAIADDLLREDVAAAADGDPARRLADAAQLAQRLRSLEARRAQRQHEARQRTAAELDRRAMERARARRAPLAFLVATLVTALVVISWLYLRADRAGKQARDSAATANAVTTFLTRDLLSSANPILSADTSVSIRDLLPEATANLDRRFKSDGPERAAIEDAVGNGYVGLGEPDHAKPLFEAALATNAKLKGDGDPETQQIRLDLLEMYRLNEDTVMMKRTAEEILAAETASGRGNTETSLRARYAIGFADCVSQGNYAVCGGPMVALADEARRRLGPHNELFLDAESTAAFVLAAAGRFDQAVPMAREALKLALETYDPTSLVVAERKVRLAQVLEEDNQLDEAIALCQEARRDLLSTTGRESQESVLAASTLGIAFVQAKRPADAVPLLQLVLDYIKRAHGDAFYGTRMAMSNLAYALAGAGRPTEAAAMEEQVIDIGKRLGTADTMDGLSYVDAAAGFYDRAGNEAMAEQLYREVVTRGRTLPIKGQARFARIIFHFAVLLAKLHEDDEARALFQESIAIDRATLGPDDPQTKAAEAALDTLAAGLAPKPAVIAN